MTVGRRVTIEPLGRGRVRSVRPHEHLFKQWTLAALALFTPIFVVLYWLAIPAGAGAPVLIAHLGLTVVFGLSVAAYSLMKIWVAPSGITERDQFGRIHEVPVGRVGSVIRLDLYRGGSLAPEPRLFVVDADGLLLTRMHGRCWSAEAMEAVIDGLGAPVVRLAEPMSLPELNRVHPELLLWFERGLVARDASD